MCIGVSLRVCERLRGDLVRCTDAAGQPYGVPVQTALLDTPPSPGDWLLVHIDTALRVIDREEARQISDALEAVERAARGEEFSHLIADLIDREPQLPPHLQAAPEPGPSSPGSRRQPDTPQDRHEESPCFRNRILPSPSR